VIFLLDDGGRVGARGRCRLLLIYHVDVEKQLPMPIITWDRHSVVIWKVDIHSSMQRQLADVDLCPLIIQETKDLDLDFEHFDWLGAEG